MSETENPEDQSQVDEDVAATESNGSDNSTENLSTPEFQELQPG